MAEEAPLARSLTSREHEILRLVCEDRTTIQIAGRLGISERTARWHQSKLFEKLGVQGAAGITIKALQEGLLEGVPEIKNVQGFAQVREDGRFLHVDAEYCKLAGWSLPELTTTSFQAITHPDDLEADCELFRQLIGGDISNYSMTKRYIRKDDTLSWVDLTVKPLESSRGRIYLASVTPCPARNGA